MSAAEFDAAAEGAAAAEGPAAAPTAATASGASARVASLKELLDRFDRAGQHFGESGRQALLGVREALKVLEELAQAYGTDVPALRNLSAGMVLVRGALDLWIARLPALVDASGTLEIRLDALAILRDLLVAELMRAETAGDQARKDGLLTVIGVIDQEIERVATSVPAPGAKDTEQARAGVQWIEVER